MVTHCPSEIGAVYFAIRSPRAAAFPCVPPTEIETTANEGA